MDIQAEKLILMNWIAELDDRAVINQLIALQNQLQQDSTGEWDSLSEYQKQHILKALAEADSDLGVPAKEVIARSREKYGLKG